MPENSKKDYDQSPVENEPLDVQVEYWKARAFFFEQRAYANLEREQEEEDSGDWWKHCDE